MVFWRVQARQQQRHSQPGETEPLSRPSDDLTPGTIAVTKVKGHAPRRCAVVAWQGERLSQTSPKLEVLLYEGSKLIVFKYLDMNGDRGAGSSAAHRECDGMRVRLSV